MTARHGVALFIHFSGLWDSLAIKQHPEWACVRSDGSVDYNATSTFGPYVDQLMIPELKEAASKYDLDGAWVDGECWAAKLDYSDAAAKAFKAATGMSELPRSADEPGWLEFLELNRRQFRKYVRYYVEELHKFRPGFQIASNWLYTTFVPERPEIPIDFVSGDYLGNASISTARLESRYLSFIDKPWDLMAWGFQQASGRRQGNAHKPAIQLQQEASVVLAQGGGFQTYYQPTRAGWLDDALIGVMSKVGRFCRDRQEVCHKSVPVPQIGLIFSTTSLYRQSGKLFGGWGAATSPARGLLDALVDNQYSVDVLPEWKLDEVIGTYPLIAVPDWPELGLRVKDIVTRYVKGGGRALICGAANAELFSNELKVRFIDGPKEGYAYLKGDEVMANVYGLWQKIRPESARSIEERFRTHDSTRDAECAATLTLLESGLIAAIYGPIGSQYASSHQAALRQFIRRVAERVFTPMVRVEGPPTVEVALRRKDRKLLINLLNSAGMQIAGDYVTGDFVPPVGPIRVSARLDRNPIKAMLAPSGRSIVGRHENGVWTATLDRLEIYDIIVLET